MRIINIFLDGLVSLIGWILGKAVNYYPGYEEAGLSREEWDTKTREYKERFWRELKEHGG